MELLKNHTNHLADHFLLNWNPVPHLWRAIAFKEAHEICINEDLKTAITYLQNTSLFMNCRIKLTKKVCETIILLADINSTHESTIIDNTHESVTMWESYYYNDQDYPKEQPAI